MGLTDSTSTTTGARSPFLRNLRSGVDGGAATTPTGHSASATAGERSRFLRNCRSGVNAAAATTTPGLSASSSKGREASHTSHLSEQMGLFNVHRPQGHSLAPGDGGGDREGMAGGSGG